MKKRLTYKELEERLQKAEEQLLSISAAGTGVHPPESINTSNKLSDGLTAFDSDRLKLALTAANAGIWEWDLATNENYWSDELWELYGLEKHGCKPSYDNWLKTVHPEDADAAEKAIKIAVSNSAELYSEWRVINSAGGSRWLMSRGKPVKDAEGKTIRYIGVVIDITARRQMEERLRENEFLLKMGYDAAGIGTWTRNYLTDMLHFDERGMQHYGVTAPDMHFTDVMKHIHPDDRERLKSEIQEATGPQFSGIYSTEYRVIHADGSIHWLDVSVNMKYTGCGGSRIAVFGFGTSMDITARKSAEHDLLESKRKLEAALASMTDAVFISDKEGNFVDFNDAFATVHKFRDKEECAKKFSEYPDILDVFMASGELAPIDMWAIPRALRGEIGTNVEYSLRRKDTGERWFGSYSFAPIKDSSGTIVGSVVVGRDITEKKLTEAALRQSEENFSKAFKSSPAALLITRLSDGLFMELNEAYTAIIGYTRDELIGRRSTEFNIYLDKNLRNFLVEKLSTDGSVRNFETNIRNKQQQVRYITFSQELINFNGEACILTSIIDITERKKAEENIRQLNAELEERIAKRTAELSDLYNNAPCGYHSIDATGLVVMINDTELRWLGYSREEVIGKKNVAELFTSESLTVFKNNFPAFLATGKRENLEFELIRKDGSLLPILLSATAVYDEDGRFLMSRSTMIDYTDKKNTESALKASEERLIAVNRELEAFAYSISHDLRAPLRSIDGFARMILEDYSGGFDQECSRKFNIIRSSAQKMDRLITDLLALSRITRSEMYLTRVDMNKLISAVILETLPAEDKDAVAFEIAELPAVNGDPTLLKQVWVNLISNALKYTKPKPERRIQIESYIEDGMNVYCITDNGVGFDPRYRDKLFGIFQRLHKASEFEGTGVGLAIVQRIIFRHGGRVWADSEQNAGAKFYIALPKDDN